MARNPKNKKLAARVTREGVLVVEIGVDVLKHATENGQFNPRDVGGAAGLLTVANPRGFARTVARELMAEVGEDGSTPITLAIDRAIESALESDIDNVVEA